MNNDQLIDKIKRTMAEWHGEDNLDDTHIELLCDMTTFAAIPINAGVCDNPSDLIIMLNEITKAAFNLGYAKGQYDNE